MKTITTIEQIVQISRSLSNIERVRLVSLLKDGKPKSLREIYDQSRSKINLEHRETIYKYLESLVKAGIVRKTESTDGVKYSLSGEKIVFDFSQIDTH